MIPIRNALRAFLLAGIEAVARGAIVEYNSSVIFNPFIMPK